MQYSVRIGDEQTQIDATPPDGDGHLRMTAREQTRELTMRSIGAHHVQVTAKPSPASPTAPAPTPVTENVFVARGDDGVWVWVAGRARLVQEVAERRARRGPGADVGQSVTPPMPAVVTKVLVELGQTVDKGQALVVVSAMKMEMTLTAPHAGQVSAIRTEEGAKVNPGDILVDVAAAEGAEEPHS